jgi:UDP-N-acetylmuramate--alanine ligase
MKHIYLIGIGGTGLSAIARVLLEKGYIVSGSDRVASPLFSSITAAGAKTYLGHSAEHVIGADLVVRSSAVPDDNPEVIAALNAGIPVVKRVDFLPTLIEGKQTIAIAGSHGKTTTTAMIAWILEKLGEDPSYLVGSEITQLGRNAHAGTGEHFVIEADEYDNMFLGLEPFIAVLTNIEHDHPDCFPTEETYRMAFKSFMKRLKPDGVALICKDDPQACAIMEEFQSTGMNIMSYSLSRDADYFAKISEDMGTLPAFEIRYRQSAEKVVSLGKVNLSIPGQHNILNATAAIGVIHQLGLPIQKALTALGEFTGAGRRFEILGECHQITIIDDYGHHPTEIAATLKAARVAYPDHRLWAVWQPHTYTRTQTLEKSFIEALNLADQALILKIYGAREENREYSAETIANALPEGKAVYKETFDEAIQDLLARLSPEDVAIFFSAGDATEVSRSVLSHLQKSTNHGAELAGK